MGDALSAHEPRKFAFFAPSMAGGGAERAILRLAGGVASRGFEVHLVLAQADGPFMVDVPDDVRVVDLQAKRVLTSLPALVRYLRRERPDAIASVLDYANILAVWARRLAGRPRIAIVIEQNTISQSSSNSLTARGRMMPRLAWLFYRWADHIVGNSEGVTDDLRRVLGEGVSSRLHTIYNPIVTEDLVAKARVEPRHRWFSDDTPVLVAVGRLNPQKDYETMLRAFAKATATHEARLLIFGEGPERPALQSLIVELGLEGSVELPGFTSNPYSSVAAACAYVMSSRWEGLPTVLVEALYCGTPVISTDCPSGPREILDGGRYGRLVPVGDAGALGDAMVEAVKGELDRPPPESWQPYQQAVVVDQYLDLLADRR